MATVQKVKISWLRTLALPKLYRDAAGATGISRLATYCAAVEKAPQGPRWVLPWDGREWSQFWASNVKPGYRRGVDSVLAWDRNTPFRDSIDPHVALRADHAFGLSGVELFCDRYLYPTGIAVVVTATIAGEFEAEQLLKLIEVLDSEQVLRCSDPEVSGSVQELITAMLDRLQIDVVGEIDSGATGSNRASTIATVLASKGWPAGAVTDGDDRHRVLAGLCRRDARVLLGPIDALSGSVVEPYGAESATIRVVIGGGRAIWSPQAAEDGSEVHRFTCYHDNQVLAHLQAGMILDTATSLPNPAVASDDAEVREIEEMITNLADLLLSGARDKIYATGLVERKFQDSRLLPRLQLLSSALGRTKILSARS